CPGWRKRVPPVMRDARFRRGGARIAAGIVLAAVLASGVRAETFPLFDDEDPSSVFTASTQNLTLDASFPALEPPDLVAAALAGTDERAPEPTALAPKGRYRNRRRATAVSTAVLVLSAVAASSTIWKHGYEPFNFHNEFWFGRNTYAGGADKASHFVFYNGLTRELSIGYYPMGYSADEASLMAFLVAMGAGLATEIGDGFTQFGFSYEDLVTDAVGAGTAVLISRNHLDDLIGFRFGPVPNRLPYPCCPEDNLGKD